MRITLFLVFCVVVASAQTGLEVELLDVGTSGTGEAKLVVADVRYRADIAGPLRLGLQASLTEQAGWDDVAVGTVSGDTQVMAEPDWRTGVLLWSAGLDWPEDYADSMRLRVTAQAGGAITGTYLSVDISGGAAAERYPMTALDTLPEPLPDVYRESEIVLRRVPAGSFTMGSPPDETGHLDGETQHQVTLTEDYYLAMFELTQRQWELIAGSRAGQFEGDRLPVDEVSWNDVRGGQWPAEGGKPAGASLMGTLREKTGQPFDLPTEARWEYACRAGTTRAYNDPTRNGGEGADCLTTAQEQDTNLDPLARYWYNGARPDAGMAEVGSYRPNAWGLYDMHGNVWEWCLDWVADYGGDVVDPVGGETGDYRVQRGGNWRLNAWLCRSAMRASNDPEASFVGLGVRLCLSTEAVAVDQEVTVSAASSPFVLDTREAFSLVVPLRQSWNLIGWNVNRTWYSEEVPASVDLLPATIAAATSGDIGQAPPLLQLADAYALIRSFDAAGGHSYDPELPFFSDLTYLASGYGYWLRVEEPNRELTFEGVLPPPRATLELPAGWSLIANWTHYLYHDATFDPGNSVCPLPAGLESVEVAGMADVFAALGDRLEVVRTFDCAGGHSYDPDLPQFSDLTYLSPGFGLWIRLSEPVADFRWPAPGDLP